MKNLDFYDVIDAEIATIIDSLDNDEIKKKNEEGKRIVFYCGFFRTIYRKQQMS